MASKKRKRAPTTGKQSSGDRAAKKKSDKDPAQIPMAKFSVVSASAPVTGTAETKAAAQTQCRIFLLPLELRNMIYNYVFDTGAVGKEKHSRVYIIGERRRQRIQNSATRNNNYKLENFGHRHSALLKTCRAIHNECKSFLDSKITYRFNSPLAVRDFLCGGNLDSAQFSTRNLDVLDKAVKVQVMIDPSQHDSVSFSYGFDIVLRSMYAHESMKKPRRLGSTLIDKDDVDGTPSPACEKARKRLASAELMLFRMSRASPKILGLIAELYARNTV
ncbi:hypothetical protein KCU65_g5709, partial [Aureobasidium melanogenum]